jgi:O-antigen ligase
MKFKKEFILFFGLLALAAALGSWQGQYIAALQYNPDQSRSLLLVGATAIWIVLYLILRKEINFHFPFKPFFFLLVLDLLVICFFRDDIAKSIRNFTSIVLTYGIIFFISAIAQSIRFKRAASIITLAITLIIIASAFIHATKVSPLKFFEHDDPTNRMGGLFTFAHIGLMAGFNIVLSLIILNMGKLKVIEYLFHAVQIILMLIAIALSDTRSALLALSLSICYIVYLSLKKPKNILPVVSTVAMIVFLAYFAYSSYLANTTGELTYTESINYRANIWKISLSGVWQRPFAGFGSESYLAQTMEAVQFNPGLSDPHSAILGLALQSGIPAALLFLILYVKISTKALSSNFRMVFALAIYWAVAPFFWGDTYLQAIGMIQIIFGVSFFAVISHRDLYETKQAYPIETED